MLNSNVHIVIIGEFHFKVGGEELNKHTSFRSNPIVLNYVPYCTCIFIE